MVPPYCSINPDIRYIESLGYPDKIYEISSTCRRMSKGVEADGLPFPLNPFIQQLSSPKSNRIFRVDVTTAKYTKAQISSICMENTFR